MSRKELVSLFWTGLLILFIRGFIVEPFKIPSGSMIPTLLIGDHIFVAKSSYDFRVPFTNIPILKIADPRRGDVVVFDYPNYENAEEKDGLYYIKRLIGVPGDKISFKGGVPYFDGAPVKQESVTEVNTGEQNRIPGFVLFPANKLFLETLPGVAKPHWVQRYPYRTENLSTAIEELKSVAGKDCIDPGEGVNNPLVRYNPIFLNEVCSFVVPENHYFFVGDNRDDSADGREWGFVERNRLRGRALFVWLPRLAENSLPEEGGPILRWSRLGQSIK